MTKFQWAIIVMLVFGMYMIFSPYQNCLRSEQVFCSHKPW